MGRPKIDHSTTVCAACGKLGGYRAKGLCKRCYGQAYYQETNVGDKHLKRLEASKKWNRENRDRFNENKRRSYAGEKLEPTSPSDVVCSGCTVLLPHFAKGMCRSCYGSAYGKKFRARNLARKYNLSQTEHEEILARADGHCEICAGAFSKLMTDHEHKTGKVRGMLCVRCNYAIGYIETTPEDVLIKMRAYLEKHNQG